MRPTRISYNSCNPLCKGVCGPSGLEQMCYVSLAAPDVASATNLPDGGGVRKPGSSFPPLTVTLFVSQAERMLRGAVGWQHIGGLRGLHGRRDRDVRAEEGALRPLQHHLQGPGERLAAGLLHQRQSPNTPFCQTHKVKLVPLQELRSFFFFAFYHL